MLNAARFLAVTLGALLSTSCAMPTDRAGCPKTQQTGLRGAEWRLCPLQALPPHGGPRLTGLALGRTLTPTELRQALTRVPVQVRVVYFAAGDVRGTWARPAAVPAAEMLSEVSPLHRDATADGQAWVRRYARSIISAKKLDRFAGAFQSKADVAEVNASASVRSGLRELVKAHRAWLDARAAAQETCGFVVALQVAGTPEQLSNFARLIDAEGFTFDQGELFNALRPRDPADLLRRRAPLPTDLPGAEVLRLAQAALRDFR